MYGSRTATWALVTAEEEPVVLQLDGTTSRTSLSKVRLVLLMHAGGRWWRHARQIFPHGAMADAMRCCGGGVNGMPVSLLLLLLLLLLLFKQIR